MADRYDPPLRTSPQDVTAELQLDGLLIRQVLVWPNAVEIRPHVGPPRVIALQPNGWPEASAVMSTDDN